MLIKIEDRRQIAVEPLQDVDAHFVKKDTFPITSFKNNGSGITILTSMEGGTNEKGTFALLITKLVTFQFPLKEQWAAFGLRCRFLHPIGSQWV